MPQIAHSLRIKYGLTYEPNESKVKEWARQVRAFQKLGHDIEAAGHAAAKATFPDYRTMFYASEADTIEALLTQAGDR